MKLENGWKQWKYFDAETEVDGDQIDITCYTPVLESAGATEAYFYRDGISPCIAVNFPTLVTPSLALQLGAAIEHACGYPLRLTCLRTRSIEFAVEGKFLLPENMEYRPDHFSDYGERISTLAAAWATS